MYDYIGEIRSQLGNRNRNAAERRRVYSGISQRVRLSFIDPYTLELELRKLHRAINSFESELRSTQFQRIQAAMASARQRDAAARKEAMERAQKAMALWLSEEGKWQEEERARRKLERRARKEANEPKRSDRTAHNRTKRQQKKAIKLQGRQLERAAQQESARAEKWYRTYREALAEMASPAPSLAPDGRLDAGPNVEYDISIASDDLATLPIRQRALIDTITKNLRGNTPPGVRDALEGYRDELIVRGVQPVLGLLKDMVGIVGAELATPDAEGWLPPGLYTALHSFLENHILFLKHFPLDPKREELYARTPIDEASATGPKLSAPFEQVARATLPANLAGLTTDDFKKIVESLATFAKIISTLPAPAPAAGQSAPARKDDPNAPPSPSGLTPDDRILPDWNVSPKKRALLSGLGFFERVYNLVGTTAQLAGPPEGNTLLLALREAITTLSKLLSH